MLGRFFVAGALLLGLSVAQGSTRIAFTGVPAVVRAGETYNITWGGGNDTPVTLTLRKGDPSDLETIGVLADRVTESYYEWEVSEDLETASDYALQITQGQDDINYSGLFSVSGGTGSSTISYTASSTNSSNTTRTATGSSSRTTNGTESLTTTSNSTESTTTTEASTTGTGSSSTRTTRTSSSSISGTAQPTTAPVSNSSAIQLVGSAAFAMVVVGAVLFLN